MTDDFLRHGQALLEPQELLQRILKFAVKKTGASSGSLCLLNPNTGSLDIEAAAGLSARARRTKLRIGEGITGWVASRGLPLRIHDVTTDRRYVQIDPRIRAELAVPLLLRGQVIGILNLDSTTPGAFGEEEEKSLVAFAKHASESIRLSWEINQLRLRSEQLETLVDMGQTIISQDQLDIVLQRIVKESCRLMNAKLCSLMLLDENGKTLALKAWYGASKAYINKPNLPVAESLVGVVVNRLKPLTVLNVIDNQRYLNTELARREGLVSLLSVPLTFESRALGVLSVYTRETHRFSNEEIRLLSAMAGMSAVAIAKARLLEKVVRMEDELRNAERLSALGWLAAEIAHEIRNPLTVVQMLFHSMMQDVQGSETTHRDAALIETKMKQMNRILDQVLTFARSSEPELEPLHAPSLLRDVLLLTRHKLAEQKIDFRLEVDDEELRINGDRAQLEQAILNLVLNACQAMAQGGQLILSVRNQTKGGAHEVIIGIKDNGMGISRERQEELFQPFLSHKKGGTGLGLALVEKTVKSHGGHITVKSRKGSGTLFQLHFPALTDE
ncbi:MAG: GAF domain-containing protein [Candidatus Methylacidiphilales bacterium]|nr:GAF domain-containing protein [Candidatus Methylacidiphilales bacterium]